MYEHYDKLPSNSSGALNCTDSGEEERDGADVVGVSDSVSSQEEENKRTDQTNWPTIVRITLIEGTSACEARCSI